MSAPAVTNSAAARSATMRSSPIASSSARCTRSKPRFQFGSHCAVTVAIAARIAPISAVASSASISVKPAMRLRRCVRLHWAGFRRRRTVLSCRIWPGGRLHPHHHGLRHPDRLVRVDEVGVERQHVDAPAMAGRLRRRNCRASRSLRSGSPVMMRARGLDQRQVRADRARAARSSRRSASRSPRARPRRPRARPAPRSA